MHSLRAFFSISRLQDLEILLQLGREWLKWCMIVAVKTTSGIGFLEII